MGLSTLCVFCGSTDGNDPSYREAAAELGRVLAARRIEIVFGGGAVGLMGALADAALKARGRVIGVIPDALVERELAHKRATEMHVVKSMLERKKKMTAFSDAFVALPGGFGTLDELFEVLTWAQLGFHHKPCGLLDVGGFYGPLIAHIDHATEHGFIQREHRQLLRFGTDADELIDELAAAAGG